MIRSSGFPLASALLGLPNESRLSCGALKKDSFLNLRAPPASSACSATGHPDCGHRCCRRVEGRNVDIDARVSTRGIWLGTGGHDRKSYDYPRAPRRRERELD